ncbi:hypothetical protein [uncultured Aquimarina sp.]|uniref:hypothetical protein n=1 Tax=uncultured Aquimarina sp. TaxID=575652 RepID=UPI002607A61D|nr:hypothetical protein [uncultured Aquimarina sp.]
MASGFIILKDGRCFARRWTGYDEILKIVIKELRELEGGKPLAKWLKVIIPNDNLTDEMEAGWGFLDLESDEWISRKLDLRSLTKENQELFWEAIQRGKINLNYQGQGYSILSPDYFQEFYEMCELAEKGEPPMQLTHWNKLADPCNEQNGPGWKK